jgi:hypothetical protein
MHARFWRGNPERKKKLGRPRCRWNGNIKMELKKIGRVGLNLCDSGEGEMASSCERGKKLLGFIKSREFLNYRVGHEKVALVRSIA